ncbi:efflux RND transporter periplasmic adaptor subunit [Sphingomonas abietis]|uniref:Efflux RND transporter periplasmic adaptor subunit n=1 Tax=Sphingomonas abietis TaxID=3012344 RepID=A0ABY7NVI3_9SPHN|nr:efflux RND transporter periplasmic adaptor subunit [Sphingomonas abietis]WBO24577.1 efflux RND transporter periplasmic adaptor subunit [Sphingomonas abietis]
MALLATACSSDKKPPAAPTPEVGVVTLATAPVTVSNELTGRTASTTASDVRPQVDGIIKARLFQEGSVVHAGQPLYQIDPRLYKATLDSARAQLENAQATLFTDQAKANRYKTLSDNQAVSRQDIDDAVAAARAALASVHQYQAAVETARVNLEYTRVLAPITGRISRSSVTPGALVTAAQTTALATIQQLDPIYVDITQSSADLVKLRQALAKGSVLPSSAAVHLKLEDGSDYPQTGTIEFSEVTVDEDAGTVTLRARFPNPQGLLLPGMFVRVEAPQGIVPNGILVPQQGIARDAKGDATALVVDQNNKVVQRNVTTGQAIGNKWLITAGLKAGDRLIVEGTANARDGATVKPVSVKLDD